MNTKLNPRRHNSHAGTFHRHSKASAVQSVLHYFLLASLYKLVVCRCALQNGTIFYFFFRVEVHAMNVPQLKSHFRFLLLLLTTLSILSGCEDAGSVVDKVTSTVTGESAPEAKQDPAPANTSPPPAPVTPPAAPAPTPEQLIAEFNALTPLQIDDGALARVAGSPEAAAAITAIEIKSVSSVSGAGLQAMAAMPNLQSLKFTGATVSPGELNTIGKMVSLRELHLNASNLDDSVAAELANLTNLETLNIAATPISPSAGQVLAKLPKLSSLDLQATTIDDSTIMAISGLPITELNLARTRVTDAAMPTILKMPQLESLDLSFTQVTGAAFKGINRTRIKSLSVGETNFGIEGFVALKGLRSLEHLNVYNSGLVEHTKCNVFRSFPDLKTLTAGGNPLTNAGMDVFFKGHKSLEELSLMQCRSISDPGLAELIGIKTLRVLNVVNTGCTSSGAAALKQRLPDCRIVTNEAVLD